MSKMQAQAELEGLWRAAALDAGALGRVTISGRDPALPSVFRVGSAAAVSIAASAAAAAELHRLRTGVPQRVSVDRRAAGLVFRSERYVAIDGAPPPSPWGPLSGYYATARGGLVQVHANFPHHHAGVVDLLGCADDRDAVRAALAQWDAGEFEDAAAAHGLCVAQLRNRDAWLAHPQGRAVAALPLLEIERIGDAPPEPLPAGARPLDGVRVLDLTRIIAGPVCGRTLASHGADVLRVAAPRLPFIPHLWLDVARGKRSAHLDLTVPEQLDALRALVRGADVFSQAYRPGALDRFGLTPDGLADLRPGLVYVTLSAYSHAGPWAQRRGFDSLVQTASGIGDAGARAAGVAGTRPLPCQALDHATGYLAAFGATAALIRRATEGGSWRVRVSLAQTGHWLCGLGQVDGLDCTEPTAAEVAARSQTTRTSEGRVTTAVPAEQLSVTPPHWRQPATRLGADAATWQSPARAR